jgi:uncharacterized membrane protein HdeD (DUF308 family)
MLLDLLADWRLIMLRGGAALAFGVLTSVWPGLTLRALVVIFGAYALVDGVSTLLAVAHDRPVTRADRGWRIFVVSVAAGVVAFAWPGITALALLFLIAAWAIVAGALRLWTAIRARDLISHAWLAGLGGALSTIFGVLLMSLPGTRALVITWLIGWYAILFAAILFAIGWDARRLQQGRRHGGSRSVRAVPA